jgi:hypothetical protein
VSEASAVATTDLPLDVLASTIKARVEVGDRTAERAADHYRAAGLLLIEAKSRIAKDGGNFADFIYDCGVGRSRAYELIGIAKGTKTLAGIRASTAERVARHAKRVREAAESVSNGLSDQDSALAPEVVWLRAEIERLIEENRLLVAENERLRSDEGSELDCLIVTNSERSAEDIIRTEFRIEFAQALAFEGFKNAPEANNVLERCLTYVDFQAAGALLGQCTARNVIKKIRESKKADRQTAATAA